MTFDEAQEKYAERFGDILPTEEMPPSDLANLVSIVEECLRTGKPYELPSDVRRLIDEGAVF